MLPLLPEGRRIRRIVLDRKVNNFLPIKQKFMIKVFETTLPIVKLEPSQSPLRRFRLRCKAAWKGLHIVDAACPPPLSDVLSHAATYAAYCPHYISRWLKLQFLLESLCKVTTPILANTVSHSTVYALPHKGELIALGRSEITLSDDEITLSTFLPDECMSHLFSDLAIVSPPAVFRFLKLCREVLA